MSGQSVNEIASGKNVVIIAEHNNISSIDNNQGGVFTDWEMASLQLQQMIDKVVCDDPNTADLNAYVKECAKFVHSLATQGKPYNWSKNLYKMFETYVQAQAQSNPDVYHNRCRRMQQLFGYLDRYYVKHSGLPKRKQVIAKHVP